MLAVVDPLEFGFVAVVPLVELLFGLPADPLTAGLLEVTTVVFGLADTTAVLVGLLVVIVVSFGLVVTLVVPALLDLLVVVAVVFGLVVFAAVDLVLLGVPGLGLGAVELVWWMLVGSVEEVGLVTLNMAREQCKGMAVMTAS